MWVDIPKGNVPQEQVDALAERLKSLEKTVTTTPLVTISSTLRALTSLTVSSYLASGKIADFHDPAGGVEGLGQGE